MVIGFPHDSENAFEEFVTSGPKNKDQVVEKVEEWDLCYNYSR